MYQKQNSETFKDSVDDSSVGLKGANHHNQTGQHYPPGVDSGLQLTARRGEKMKALIPQAKEENFVNNQGVSKRTRALYITVLNDTLISCW